MEVSYKKAEIILSMYSDYNLLSKDIKNGRKELYEIFGKNFDKVKEKQNVFNFDVLEKYFERKNITILTLVNDDYPEKLRYIDQPPLVLYAKGDLSLLKSDSIAIVGARVPSFYGKDVTSLFSKKLAENGLTIISGLAMGVDKIAHESCLEVGGKTIAVLGNGFEHMYPALNVQLANQIEKNGLLITEFYPTFKATSYSFPARNRIIAGLSKAVLLTEASEKSGSLYTRDFALEYGKEVFVVPGNITSSKSAGTNATIKAGQGQCVTSPEDILKILNIEFSVKKQKTFELSIDEQIIVNCLSDGEKSFDYLQEKTKLLPKTLNYCLTTMQIREIIKKLPGNLYSANLEAK